jgi:TPR repeat protein
MTGERGLEAARRATVQMVRVRKGREEHRGQGLLLDVGEEALAILTCHHVIAPCSPDELFVKIRQDDGQLGEPIHVVVDENRSRRQQDAVVLRVSRTDVPIRPNPLLHEVNQSAFVGPLHATGIMYLAPYVFDGEISAGDIIPVPATQSESWPLEADTYRVRMFRLGIAGDARPSISGAVVVCDEGIFGLAEAARKESPEVGREVYLLPLSAWAEGWPALNDLIEPFIDHDLGNAAKIKRVRDLEIGTDLVVEEFRSDVYLPRPVNEEAQMALDSQEGVVIVGRPESGKTRLAWNLLHTHPNALVVIPTADEPPLSFESAGLRGRELILFFDDLHRTAQKSNVLMWRDRLRQATGQNVPLLCTSRDGVGEWRDGVCKHQRGLLSVLGKSGQVFLSAGDNRGEDLTRDEGRHLAEMLGLDEAEFESRFDGTPGSLLLALDEMRARYEDLKRASRGDVSMSRLLDSAKLLYTARQPRFSETQLKLVAETIRGNRRLSPEEWELLCDRTREEGFGRFDQHRNFQIYLPYLEHCVIYEPDLDSVEKLLSSLESERDLEALFYLSLGFVDRKPEVAERALRTVIEGGTGEAYNNLGLLLSKQVGREVEAEEMLRRALAAGNTEARLNLALLLHEQEGRKDEVEELYRKAIAAGNTDAIFDLGNLLSNQAGREEEAEELYRQAMAAGQVRAYSNLGTLLCKQAGREEEAEELYRRAMSAGLASAYNNLGTLLTYQAGRESEGSSPQSSVKVLQR